ncbi:MAG: lipopolysaccharide heptosyltransferase II [Acidobacteriota bacterium]|nr:lipopolysaccharide heptosyltransferase II [Acidobacteriota bacterium]
MHTEADGEYGKILVRAVNWIGDAVMSLPAIETLRARFPASEIVLVTKPWVAGVYEHHPAIDRQIVYDAQGEHHGVKGFASLVRQLRQERFDAAILLQNAFHAAWMAWRARIPVRIGYGRDGRGPLLTHAVEPPPPAVYGHQAYYYLHLLFRAGMIARPEPTKPLADTRVEVSAPERTWATRRLEALGIQGPRFLLGLVPGASFGPSKRWMPDRFAALADRLTEVLNADVLIFGSPSEKALAEEVAGEMEHTPVIIAGEAALRQSMALLERCRLVVTNDSGSMHLASALALPVVAIFGSTDARATRAFGPYVRVVQHVVPCNPCGLRVCPIDFRCMEGVSVAMAYRAALELVRQLGVTHEHPARESGARQREERK